MNEEPAALQIRLNHVLDMAPDAIIATDASQRITLFNKSAERIFGYHAEEVLGQFLDVLLPPQLAAAHRRYVDAFARGPETLQDMSARESIVGRHKSGRQFPAEASISKYVDGGEINFIAVVRDITVRRQAEEELRNRDQAIAKLNERLLKDNARLAALNSELEAFSYSVSHDLRAPLRAIDGFSRMLQQEFGEAGLDERAQDYLARICRAAQRMSMLIDDLLTLARISRAEVTRLNVDLSEQVREVLTTLRAAAAERPAEFRIADGIHASADVRLLRIALENLLANAWKFTGDRSPARIEFGTTERDGSLAYYVRDNGVGFDMTYAGKLFGAFQRLHDDRKFPGDGIGLAIVKRIINLHGGRIWAEAEQDKGATFFFTL
jgi:PAS domain S-box-containing protein